MYSYTALHDLALTDVSTTLSFFCCVFFMLSGLSPIPGILHVFPTLLKWPDLPLFSSSLGFKTYLMILLRPFLKLSPLRVDEESLLYIPKWSYTRPYCRELKKLYYNFLFICLSAHWSFISLSTLLYELCGTKEGEESHVLGRWIYK